MSVTFRYKTIERPEPLEPIKCPVIPLTVSAPDGNVQLEYLGLLDSGADLSVIERDVAEILGLNLSGKKDTSRGVGGVVETIDSEIKIQFLKGHERYMFTIPVLILCDETELGMLLLGRDGFFDKFTVTFYEKDQKFRLKRGD